MLLFLASHSPKVCTEGFERSRDVDASRIEDLLLEIAIDLEHVAQLVGELLAHLSCCSFCCR